MLIFIRAFCSQARLKSDLIREKGFDFGLINFDSKQLLNHLIMYLLNMFTEYVLLFDSVF